MDNLPRPYRIDPAVRSRVCEHCASTFTAGRSDQRFCSDSCRLRRWRTRRKVHSAIGSGDLERLATLLTEIDRLERQVAELQHANAALREALADARTCSVPPRWTRPSPDLSSRPDG